MAVPYKLNYFEIETGIDSTSTFIHTGDFTATKLKKYLGTSNDILLGDGTTASLSGKQNTITLTTTGSSGAATLIGATLNIPNYGGALSGYVPYTGATQALNLGTNNGILLTDTGTSSSIAITSSSTGSGAIVVNKSVDGQGVTVNNAGIGSGFYANNSSTGNGITIGNASTGKGLVIDNAALAIGDPFVYTLGGAAFVKAKIDYLGNITGNSFVKTGGTSSQFLKADGSVDSTAYGTGSVTSVAALTLGTTGTDLSSTVANGNTTPVITLNVPTASATNRGALSSSDWTTFNSKQDAITLTTSGSSGASTFISNTLNVPNYTLSGLGGVPTSRTLTINGTTQDLSADRTFSVGTVTSVGLSMPAAFSVASSPVTGAGTIAVTGAGLASQYIRGDGQLADFPTGGGGGGSSVSYYLNGSVNQGTFAGNTYYEMNKTPIFGAGTDFSIATNGYIAQFITDVNDPNSLLIPGGNWNLEFYFSASSGGGSPTFYAELYKYDGTTFTLIASNATNPELIAFGTTIAPYFSPLAVPETVLLATDRLAIRIYVVVSGRTITLHTENSNLSQVITTFTTGLQALNGLTKQTQYLAVGTSGTDFAISSSVDTHTFNLPTASATNRGALSSANWTTFNSKQDAITLTTTGSSGASTFISNTLNIPNYTLSGLGGVPTTRQLTINGTAYDLSADRTWSVGTVTSVAALTLGTSGTDLSSTVANGSTTPVITLNVPTASATNRGALSSGDWTTFNSKQDTITLTTTGTSGAATFIANTLNIPQYQSVLTNPVTGTGTTNYLPKFTASSTIGDSLFYDNGTLTAVGNRVSTNSFVGLVRNFNVLGTDAAVRVARYTDSYATLHPTVELLNYSDDGVYRRFYWDNFVNGDDSFAIRQRLTGGGVATSGTLIDQVRLMIFSGGNVGINTTTDAGFRLDVNGTGRFSGNLSVSSGNQLRLFQSNNANFSYLQSITDGDFVVSTGGTANALIIANNGAATFASTVSATQGLFSIANNAGVQVRSGNTSNYTYIGLGRNSEEASIGIPAAADQFMTGAAAGDITINNTSGKICLGTAAVTRLAITSGGNVGIGTTNPAILGTTFTNQFTVSTTSGFANIAAAGATGSGGGLDLGTQTIRQAGIYSLDGSHLALYTNGTNSGSSITERMRITSGGNVLIGTTTDGGQKLQIQGNMINTVANNTLVHRVTGATTGYMYGYWTNTSGSLLYGVEGSVGGNLQTGSSAYDAVITTAQANGLSIGVNQTQFMRITSGLQAYFSGTGNTVNITSDNNTLSLGLGYQGTYSGYLGGFGSALYGYSTNGGYVLLNSSSVWVAASDAKRKRNFETYSNGLASILGLQPKLYNMDFQEDGDEKQVGLIAQEVKQFIPKAYNENGDFIGLDYNAIIVTMVNAIKELKTEIDILKNN